jgi:hypothetical protein
MKIRIDSSTSYRGRNSRPNLPVLGFFLLLALGVAAVGAVFSPGLSASATQWYAALIKPEWVPPPQWFGPVWTALYISMAIAAWLVWRERYHRARAVAMSAYAAQLLLNARLVDCRGLDIARVRARKSRGGRDSGAVLAVGVVRRRPDAEGLAPQPLSVRL